MPETTDIDVVAAQTTAPDMPPTQIEEAVQAAAAHPMTDRDIFLHEGHQIITNGMADVNRAAAANSPVGMARALETTLRAFLAHLAAA